MSEIAITDLADYNEGKLRFEWVDIDSFDDEDDLGTIIKEFIEINDPSHEEWIISDYDDFPNLGENPSFEDIIKVKEAIDIINESEAAAIVGAYMNNFGGNADDLDNLEEAYAGLWDTEQDFTENLLDELGELDSIPENLRSYFDYEKYNRDLFMTDYWSADIDHQVAVFRTM